jgi:hypothetical protein
MNTTLLILLLERANEFGTWNLEFGTNKSLL